MLAPAFVFGERRHLRLFCSSLFLSSLLPLGKDVEHAPPGEAVIQTPRWPRRRGLPDHVQPCSLPCSGVAQWPGGLLERKGLYEK